jgi:ribosomal protein L27
MTGGFSTPKKDKMLKVSQGQAVKTGQILVRGLNTYKSGINAKGLNPIFALCSGKVFFTKKKTPYGKVRTFVNVEPLKETPQK